MIANPWKESSGTCACCGRTSRTIWGDVSDSGRTHAVYFVQWTSGAPDHFPNIDLVLGPWGDNTGPTDRVLVSLLFKPARDGGSFMVVDGQERQVHKQSICARGLARAEVLDTQLAHQVFAYVDAIWETDARISELRELNDAT